MAKGSRNEDEDHAVAEMAGRAIALLGEMSLFTDEPGKMTRLYLSRAHRQCADAVTKMMRVAGMSVSMDAAGTVIGRYASSDPAAPTLMIGSHIDSVVNGGNYDGPLGVVCGIVVVEALHRQGVRLPVSLEVVAFGDEESIRFPTILASSSVFAGRYDPRWLETADNDGICLRDALAVFGGDPGALATPPPPRTDLVGYLEIHIEQGPVLDREAVPLGVVSAISGITRMRGEVLGTPGHAGTLPMADRMDALVAFARVVEAVREVAVRSPGSVATIGWANIEPGVSNVVPGRVEFIAEARAPEDDVRHALVAEIERRVRAVAQESGSAIGLDVVSEVAATPMSADIGSALAEAIRAEQLPLRHLPSGAGHDAMMMAKVAPAGMLFVRCRDGISHNPRESVSDEDIASATRVLYRTVRNFVASERRSAAA